MHFLNWVLEKQEDKGSLGLFADILWNDMNNGCGLRYTTPIEWREHFLNKHPRTSKALIELLEESFEAYADRVSAANQSK